MEKHRITIRLPQHDLHSIDLFIRAGEFSSRSEVIRHAVNDFIKNDERVKIPILEIREEVEREQNNSLKNIKIERDNEYVQMVLEKVTNACKNNRNDMPPIIKAAEAYASLGEIVSAMKSVFGEWQEKTII